MCKLIWRVEMQQLYLNRQILLLIKRFYLNETVRSSLSELSSYIFINFTLSNFMEKKYTDLPYHILLQLDQLNLSYHHLVQPHNLRQ